jgi:hypothetical protein
MHVTYRRSMFCVLPGNVYLVHFRDARKWSNALLFHQRMIKLNSVVDAVRTHNLLGSDDFQAFLECPGMAQLHGFPSDLDVPAFVNLYELLDENWIGERVLDTRAYQIMMEINSRADSPFIRILPSIFHVQLTNAYRAGCLHKS